MHAWNAFNLVIGRRVRSCVRPHHCDPFVLRASRCPGCLMYVVFPVPACRRPTFRRFLSVTHRSTLIHARRISSDASPRTKSYHKWDQLPQQSRDWASAPRPTTQKADMACGPPASRRPLPKRVNALMVTPVERAMAPVAPAQQSSPPRSLSVPPSTLGCGNPLAPQLVTNYVHWRRSVVCRVACRRLLQAPPLGGCSVLLMSTFCGTVAGGGVKSLSVKTRGSSRTSRPTSLGAFSELSWLCTERASCSSARNPSDRCLRASVHPLCEQNQP